MDGWPEKRIFFIFIFMKSLPMYGICPVYVTMAARDSKSACIGLVGFS